MRARASRIILILEELTQNCTKYETTGQARRDHTVLRVTSIIENQINEERFECYGRK